MGYLCDLKADLTDLYAITETWLTQKDVVVRAELALEGYNFVDHPREGRDGGCKGLIYRDALRVQKVKAGGRESFEFSEWVVSSINHNFRVYL